MSILTKVCTSDTIRFTSIPAESRISYLAVADLYIVLFDAIVTNPEKVGHGREGFYFAESGEHTWYDISKEISKVLVELGIGKSKEPTPFTRDELARYFISEVREGACGFFRSLAQLFFRILETISVVTVDAVEIVLVPSVGDHERPLAT